MESNDTRLLITRNLLKKRDAQNATTALCPIPMYKIMYNEIGRCGVAHRLRCYEDYCTCTLASSALLSAVSLARAQFSGKRAQALFAGIATHSVNVLGQGGEFRLVYAHDCAEDLGLYCTPVPRNQPRIDPARSK